MNLETLQGDLNNLGELFNSGKYIQCCYALDQINDHLNPSFFTSSNDNFDIEFLNNQFFSHIMNLSVQKNEKLIQASKKFLVHWFSIYATISPLDFIKTFYFLMPEAKKLQFLIILLPTLDIAFANLGKADIENDIQLVLNLISSITAHFDSETVPIQAWEIISNFCQDSEIIRYLPQCQQNPKATNVLIRRNPVLFIDSIFPSASFEFLSELLSIVKPGHEFNYSTILDRISKEIINPNNENVNYNNGCKLLSDIINYIELPIKDDVSSLISKIIENVSLSVNSDLNNIHPTSAYGIFTLLLSASKKHLYPKESLKTVNKALVVKVQSSAARAAYLDSILYCIEKGDDLTPLHQISSTFKPWINQVDFIREIEIVSEHITKLVEIDKRFLTHFVWACCHPLLRDPTAALAILKFFNKLDNEILFDKQASLKVDKLVYAYIKLNDHNLNNQITKFIQKCHIRIDISKIDLFSENIGFLIPYVDNQLFKEMIEYNMFPSSSFNHAINFMVRSQNEYRRYLNHVFGILELIANEFGIDLNETYTQNSLQFTKYDESLISRKQIHELFTSINGSLYESHFGHLVKSVATALTLTFPSKPNPNNLQAEICCISKIVVLASKIITLCPSSLFELLTKCRMYYTNSGKDEKMRLIFHKGLLDIQKSQLSTIFSANYVKYLFCIHNPEQVFKENAKYAFTAAQSDRFVANHMKALIDKDYFSELKDFVDITNLGPMPTFLSFIDSKRKGGEWVNRCANEIDPNDWILSRSDNPETIFSQLLLNENHKQKIINIITKRYKKITTEKPKQTPQNFDYSCRSPTFSLNPLKITEVDQKMHETEPATLYNVISFLYHSTLPLPENVTLKYIEELALNNFRSSKMLIGFFLYAYKMKYQINFDEWMKKLYIKTFNDTWILVVALFLLNVKGSITDLKNLYQNIIKKCFVSLGYQKLSHKTFIQAYQKETGIKWFFARNAILVDIDHFKDFPLLVAELKTNRKIFMNFFENMTDMTNKTMIKLVLSTMSNILAKPPDCDLVLHGLIPSNFPFPPRMMSFKEATIQFKKSKYQEEIINAIIFGLEKLPFVPLSFYYFFETINLKDEQYKKIEDLFFLIRDNNHNNSHHNSHPKYFTSLRNLTAPGYYLLENHQEEEINDFFSLKPPSFTRSYFRSLQCNFARSINPNLAKRAVEHLTDVFPVLCYSGFSKFGMKMWNDAIPLSKLYFGSFDSENGKNLIKMLNIVSKETIDIYNGLCSLSDNQLAKLILYTKTMLKEELGRLILDTAVSESSNFVFASEVIKDVIKVLGHASTLAIVGNRDFLGKKNFELVVIVLHVLEIDMKKENVKDGLAFYEVLRSEKDNLFPDQLKAKVFSNFTDKDSLDAVIHYKLSNKSDESNNSNQPQ